MTGLSRRRVGLRSPFVLKEGVGRRSRYVDDRFRDRDLDAAGPCVGFVFGSVLRGCLGGPDTILGPKLDLLI